jgi:hypothetical protein
VYSCRLLVSEVKHGIERYLVDVWMFVKEVTCMFGLVSFGVRSACHHLQPAVHNWPSAVESAVATSKVLVLRRSLPNTPTFSHGIISRLVPVALPY